MFGSVAAPGGGPGAPAAARPAALQRGAGAAVDDLEGNSTAPTKGAKTWQKMGKNGQD